MTNDFRIEKMGLNFVALAWKFHVSATSCDNPDHYNNYIRFNAIADQNAGNGVTHIVVHKDKESGEERLAGFITVKMTSLITSDEGCIGRKMGEPALEISELATDENFAGKYIGTFLVNLVLRIALVLRRDMVGVKHIVLCSDPRAVGFYEKLLFSPIRKYFEIPHEGWNQECEPMYIDINQITQNKK